MAAAVSQVFDTGGVLLAEAGTGTGKTLAYLVPAILSRQRVLVSTGTKNLQEQVFYKDVPALGDALGVPFKATYMKGRGNYLCQHRFDTLRDRGAPRTTDDRFTVRLIEDWIGETVTGDRAEIEALPEDLSFWHEVAATGENCIGSRCPRYDECFVTRMRQRAAEADLVVVNHHLLCADAAVRQSAFGEVIPACRFAIVDEAHQIEDVATQYFGVAVSNHRLLDLVRAVERVIDTGQVVEAPRAIALREDAARIRARVPLFFDAIAAARLGDRGHRARLARSGDTTCPHDLPDVDVAEPPPDTRIRFTPAFLQHVADPGQDLLNGLEALETTAAHVQDGSEDLLALGRRAAEVRAELRFLLRGDDPDFVYYLETRGRGLFLRASPIDVSTIIRDRLLDRHDATVLTSATLRVDGGFTYVRGRLGIGPALEIAVPSEFDYTSQAILYLPPDLPDPRSVAFGAAAGYEVVEIVRRTKGRAFVLFTSYATLREAQRVIEREAPYPVLVQGTAPRSVLLRDFRHTPGAVLLATSSFWQGVDVAGEALSCVIIDKLPFASPADPITAGRIEAVASCGSSPFDDYQVPLAILTLLQGLGRLIRHRTDRGVLAILDPRLRTMSYGQRFLASLPPTPITTTLDDVTRFFDAARTS
jgi:ATP-dependent DNA helicase DinG